MVGLGLKKSLSLRSRIERPFNHLLLLFFLKLPLNPMSMLSTSEGPEKATRGRVNGSHLKFLEGTQHIF
jgi:hypothetical protein